MVLMGQLLVFKIRQVDWQCNAKKQTKQQQKNSSKTKTFKETSSGSGVAQKCNTGTKQLV